MEPKTMSHPAASGGKQLSLYQAIMTPINFISFILSLYLVDCHYHDKRIQEHSGRYSRLPSWLLPAWLDRVLFRPHPYGWVNGAKPAASNSGRQERWYYHTKQKKLMKMEAADAFELSRAVLLGLCAVMLCVTWALWRFAIGLWAWYEG
ncbi:hypothetical protein F4677DRAFT_13766 [Hypoxylon crocopeplum]|nr:hypothetical protein F4677DRAFT_13766 [Hypoxylon crocopeplum]